jgi:signal transduction histidine kinase
MRAVVGSNRWAARYGLAVAAVAVAAVLNWLLWGLIKPQVSPLFIAAVMVSAWYGGLGPALLATALASFASVSFYIEPAFSFRVDVADVLRVSVFCAVGLLVSALSADRRRAEEGLRAAQAGLEQRVTQRTKELGVLNDALRAEVAERQRAQAELVGYQARLRELAAEVVLAEQRERRRLAGLLHDQIGQVLALLQIRVERLRQLDDPERRAAMCDTIDGLLDEAISRTRSITCELSPPVLYELGLGAAVEWLADQFGRQTGVAVSLQCEGAPVPVSEDVSVTLFQTVRELLANVAKHARAGRVTVALRWRAGEVEAAVEDDGVGFDPREVSQQPVSDSFGLFSVRERLQHQGGSMTVEAQPSRGSRISVRIPIPAAAPGPGAIPVGGEPVAAAAAGRMEVVSNDGQAHPNPAG